LTILFNLFSPEDGGRLSGGAICCREGFVVFTQEKFGLLRLDLTRVGFNALVV
jgi:hypothetical protein